MSKGNSEFRFLTGQGSELLNSFGNFNYMCQNKNRKALFVFSVLPDSITDKIHVVSLDNMKEIKYC